MIRRSSRVLKLIAVLVASALGSVAHATVTRTVGGWAGAPLDGDPQTCYKESFGGMIYVGGASCTGHRWEVPLTIDATGTSRTVNFVSSALSAQGSGCGVIVQLTQSILYRRSQPPAAATRHSSAYPSHSTTFQRTTRQSTSSASVSRFKTAIAADCNRYPGTPPPERRGNARARCHGRTTVAQPPPRWFPWRRCCAAASGPLRSRSRGRLPTSRSAGSRCRRPAACRASRNRGRSRSPVGNRR